MHLIDGVPDALRRFRDAGYALVIVTNQSGIGRGLYGWDDYEAVAARLRDLLAAEGIVLDAASPAATRRRRARPAAGGSRLPGMILAAAEQLELDLWPLAAGRRQAPRHRGRGGGRPAARRSMS